MQQKMKFLNFIWFRLVFSFKLNEYAQISKKVIRSSSVLFIRLENFVCSKLRKLGELCLIYFWN